MTRQIKLLNMFGVEMDPGIEAGIGYLATWATHGWLQIVIHSKDRISASYWRTEKGSVENHRPDFYMEGNRDSQDRFGFHS